MSHGCDVSVLFMRHQKVINYPFLLTIEYPYFSFNSVSVFDINIQNLVILLVNFCEFTLAACRVAELNDH